MFDLTMTTPLVLDNGESMDITLAEFFAVNLIEDDEREAIMTALETNGEYQDDEREPLWSLKILTRNRQ